MAVAGADDVAVALQGVEDELQRGFAHVEAVALPDCRQDVQDVATLLSIYEHGRKQPSARRHVAVSKKIMRREQRDSWSLVFSICLHKK